MCFYHQNCRVYDEFSKESFINFILIVPIPSRENRSNKVSIVIF